MSAQYYVAIIIYKSSSDSQEYTPMYEENITLIKASTAAEARQKADTLAKSRYAKFKNEKGQEITWAFDQIIDVTPILGDEIGEITEIYSRHFNNINAYNAFETLSK